MHGYRVKENQDTWLCVSGQGRHAAHKCVTIFNTLNLCNCWANLYPIYIFYTLHIYDLTYQI